MEDSLLAQLKQNYLDQNRDISILTLPTVCIICNTSNGSDDAKTVDCTHTSPHLHYKCVLNSYIIHNIGMCYDKDPHRYCTGHCEEHTRNAPDTALSKSEYEIFFDMEHKLLNIANEPTNPGFNAQKDLPIIYSIFEEIWKWIQNLICATNPTSTVSFLESYYIFQKTKYNKGLSALHSESELDCMFESGVKELARMLESQNDARKLKCKLKRDARKLRREARKLSR